MCSIPLMKGRHFCSPILVNHWQTSSVLSFPRDLACCRSMSWEEGAVTYLLLIPRFATPKAECSSSFCNWKCRLFCLPRQKISFRFQKNRFSQKFKNSKTCVNKCGNVYIKLGVGLCANLAFLKIGGKNATTQLQLPVESIRSQIHPSSLIWGSTTSEIRHWCQGEILSVPVMLKSE